MSYANFRKRKETNTHEFIAIVAMLGLLIAGLLILWYEWTIDPIQLGYILGLYALLAFGAFGYSRMKASK